MRLSASSLARLAPRVAVRSSELEQAWNFMHRRTGTSARCACLVFCGVRPSDLSAKAGANSGYSCAQNRGAASLPMSCDDIWKFEICLSPSCFSTYLTATPEFGTLCGARARSCARGSIATIPHLTWPSAPPTPLVPLPHIVQQIRNDRNAQH